MPGAPHKRLKREEYKKTQLTAAGTNGSQRIEMPKKKFYRQRAHANPFSDHALAYPASPAEMDWSTHFPSFSESEQDRQPLRRDKDTSKTSPKMSKQVEIADIGCGFGGLIVALSPLYPDTLMIGMELRTQVTDFVINRIAALRSQHSSTTTTIHPPYTNISALRTNTMKFLPNHFHPSQLSAIFLCFPDPHFKQRKHKARIVSPQLAAEYAFVVRGGGKVYTITDVRELHEWMVRHFVGEEGEVGEDETDVYGGDVTNLWERVSEEEVEGDPMVRVMREETEEGKKVSRNGGEKYVAVFRRRGDPGWVDG